MTLSLVERVVSGIHPSTTEGGEMRGGGTDPNGMNWGGMDGGRRNTTRSEIGRDLKPIAIALLLALVLFAAFVSGYAAEAQVTHHLLGAR
jgi:hypothetical protein